MRVGALVTILLLAALLGAPLRASAAGNSLTAPQVSPTSGTVTTVFTFRVSYDGRAPALGVVARVAGRTLVMALTSGSVLNGSWSTVSTLPAGSWPVTFAATVQQGNAPTLAGPTVVVGSIATAPPSGGSGPSPEVMPGPSAGSPAPTPAPAIASPSPTPASASGDPAPAATPEGGAVTGGGGGGSGGGSVTETPGGPSPGGEGVPGGPGPSAGAGGGPLAAPSGSESRDPSGLGRDGSPLGGTDADDELLVTIVVIAFAGIGAVALVGTGLLLAGRRRTARRAEPAVGPSDPSDGVASVMEARTVRRARVRLDDDPIVAAMGIGANRERRPRRRAGQTGAGPGERTTPKGG